MSAEPTPSLPMLHLSAGMAIQYVGPLQNGTSVYFFGPIGLTADPKALRSASDQFLQAARAAEREQGNGRTLER